jgi:hypothetical protein
MGIKGKQWPVLSVSSAAYIETFFRTSWPSQVNPEAMPLEEVQRTNPGSRRLRVVTSWDGGLRRRPSSG